MNKIRKKVRQLLPIFYKLRRTMYVNNLLKIYFAYGLFQRLSLPTNVGPMVEVINQFYRKQNYIRKSPESNILLPQFRYPTDSKKQQEYFEGNQLIDQHDTYYDAKANYQNSQKKYIKIKTVPT